MAVNIIIGIYDKVGNTKNNNRYTSKQRFIK